MFYETHLRDINNKKNVGDPVTSNEEISLTTNQKVSSSTFLKTQEIQDHRYEEKRVKYSKFHVLKFKNVIMLYSCNPFSPLLIFLTNNVDQQ